MPLGPSQQYLVKYNGYQLPGYAQQEAMDSNMTIANHEAAYIDGSLAEATGLANKTLNLTLRVWEPSYLEAKAAVETAASMLRSSRTYAPLYVQYTDRHYEAITASIKDAKQAGSSVRILDYDVEFNCKPWLVGETEYTITGTGTVTTDSVSPGPARTINDGGWTPTLIQITGTNPSVSAVTETGQAAGGFTVSGYVYNLMVDSDAFTALLAGDNANTLMQTVDYRTYVGPGKTTFTVSADSCIISYYDRWYI